MAEGGGRANGWMGLMRRCCGLPGEPPVANLQETVVNIRLDNTNYR